MLILFRIVLLAAVLALALNHATLVAKNIALRLAPSAPGELRAEVVKKPAPSARTVSVLRNDTDF
jgi:hypothetical protein